MSGSSRYAAIRSKSASRLAGKANDDIEPIEACGIAPESVDEGRVVAIVYGRRMAQHAVARVLQWQMEVRREATEPGRVDDLRACSPWVRES